MEIERALKLCQERKATIEFHDNDVWIICGRMGDKKIYPSPTIEESVQNMIDDTKPYFLNDAGIEGMETTVPILQLLIREAKNLRNIVQIVQDNQEFFDAQIGHSCFASLSEWLEKQVKGQWV